MQKDLNTPPEVSTGESRPAPSSPIALSDHAKALGSLPKKLIKGRRKQRRKWTGFVNRQHMWVGRRVILPTGELGEIVHVSCLIARIQTARLNEDGTNLHVNIPVEQVSVWKDPAAVALGACKRNAQERKSDLKAASARENGGKPPRPGKVRGRPRKDANRATTSQTGKPYESKFRAQCRQWLLATALLDLGCEKKLIKALGAEELVRQIELKDEQDKQRDTFVDSYYNLMEAGHSDQADKLMINYFKDNVPVTP